MSTLQTPIIPASVRSPRTARSQRWPALDVAAIRAMADPPPARSLVIHSQWLWMERAMSLSPIAAISASAESGWMDHFHRGRKWIVRFLGRQRSRHRRTVSLAVRPDGGWLRQSVHPDSSNNRIRKVSPGGRSTIAGTGTCCYSGDGGPALSAQLGYPRGIAVDGAGNLLIAEPSNNRIRKIIPGGTISTVAGNGSTGYSGDEGIATSAALASPYGVAIDTAGNLAIADYSNQRVRRMTAGGIISTLAGGAIGDGGPAPFAGLNQPGGVVGDAAGNIYIADTYNHRVRKISPNGLVSTVAGDGSSGYSGDGGPAASARLNMPRGVAIDVPAACTSRTRLTTASARSQRAGSSRPWPATASAVTRAKVARRPAHA